MNRELGTWIKSTATGLAFFGRLQEKDGLSRRVVRRGDDVVIDGFPRSANTFATDAFISAQHGNDLRIANHMHSPGQFHLARRYHVPAMLVLRHPVDAVASLMIYSRCTAESGLARYINFHDSLKSIRDSFVVAPFEEVTVDFAVSMKNLNNHFGTNFTAFVHTAENAKLLLDKNRLKVSTRTTGDVGLHISKQELVDTVKRAPQINRALEIHQLLKLG